MAPPAAPKGGALHRPVMGLPLYVWLGVAAAGLLVGIYLRRRSGSGGGAGLDQTSLGGIPTGVDQGSITDGIAGGGIAGASSGFDPQTVQDLLSRISSGSDALAAQAGDARDQAYSFAQEALDTNSALVMNMASSGGAGASAAGKAVSKPATAQVAPKGNTSTAKPKAPAVHYFTLKKQVKLGKGQTLHFTKGKGYYAA